MPKTISWERRYQFHLLEVIAHWEGRVTAEHLNRAFGISSRTTSARIFREYRDRAPDNLVYNPQRRGYVPDTSFQPLFSKGILDEYLALLGQHNTLNPSFAGLKDVPTPTELVSTIHRTVSPEVVRLLVQATQDRSRVELLYRSLSNPTGEERIIAPHTLVYAGHRWHARAWCERNRDFRDFVLTRIASGVELIGNALEQAAPELDQDWQQQLTLCLVPNPGLSKEQQELIALDYGMDDRRELRIPVRRALAHYLLQSLNIIWESKDALPHEQPLTIRNRDDIAPYLFGS
ncbi:Predicted DNA-binding transcriptional regulator YafY, contains an HTH and WYL domains [Halopseudomonas litoralis]|uniref:Predicted DNA-binding transcriptional regulator YafY, contains an HTH and WYL domains n=1 Tax=Halopseudomonas litoralis TaxID=797277 RepID=A0A1H1MRJ9_9GAMM|nr:WYL domain-containing protein [Halopseudomonas litoralis]SDR88519.1 Predicted DNA-binding transcriptional regulator YafY, contains an HTH and WYL domains [Halopseudomonas litoralis]